MDTVATRPSRVVAEALVTDDDLAALTGEAGSISAWRSLCPCIR
jgi:hypothetical protein